MRISGSLSPPACTCTGSPTTSHPARASPNCAASRASGSRHCTSCSPTSTARFRRNYNPDAWDSQDPVNLALSAANICLYGVVHSAVLAMGCSPALGFIHSGTQHAFIYDIADLYKAETTIPLAFELHDSARPEIAVRGKLRDKFRLFRLLPRIVSDIQQVLDPESAPGAFDRSADLVHLWDPEFAALPAGVNYADEEP